MENFKKGIEGLLVMSREQMVKIKGGTQTSDVGCLGKPCNSDQECCDDQPTCEFGGTAKLCQ